MKRKETASCSRFEFENIYLGNRQVKGRNLGLKLSLAASSS